MKFRPTTGKTLASDLHAFAHRLADAEPELREELATWLNKKLDELVQADFFGTEGTSDPRGDHR